MATIEFQTSIGKDQVIRPPAGAMLPQGAVEVWVRPATISGSGQSAEDPLGTTRAWLLALAAEVDRANPELPSDLAERHDHYAHGKSP
jgi:hypothetical protein